MTSEPIMTEERVYDLITGGNLPKPVALTVIRSYGHRKAIEALQQARDAMPGATENIEAVEIEKRIQSCLEQLDELIALSITNIGQGASKK